MQAKKDSGDQGEAGIPRAEVVRDPIYLKIGAAGGVLAGLAMIICALYLLLIGATTIPLIAGIAITGAIEAATGVFTYLGHRAAWAFLLSTSGTASVVFLFSAPRLRDSLGTSIEMALVPSLIFGLLVLLLAIEPMPDGGLVQAEDI